MKAVLLILFIAAFLILEALIGGTRLLFSFPGLQLIAVAGILSLWPSFRHNRNYSVACVASTLVFLGYLLLRNRLSPIDYIARMQFFIAAGCLLIYLLGVFIWDKPKDRRALILALLVMALAQVIVGFIQFKQGHRSFPLPWASRQDDWWRASGFYISPNHFAGFLEIMALMAFSLVFWGRLNVTLKVLCGYVGIMCVAGVAMSGSRGGYISFSAGALVLLILSLLCWKKLVPHRFWAIAGIAVVATATLFTVVITVMLANTGVRERLMAVNDTENMRLQLWQAALQQFQLSPMIGTGGFTYEYYGRLFRDPSVQNDPIHVHNDYLQLLADYGVIACLLFAATYLAHGISGLRGLKFLLQRTADTGDTQSDGLALCLGALSGLAAYTVHSVVDFNMHITANALLMTFLLAILASPGVQAEYESRFASTLAGGCRWILLPACSAGLLIYTTLLFPGEWHAEQARLALRDYRLEDALKEAKAGLKAETSNPNLYYYAGEAAREMAAQKKGDVPQLRLWATHYFTQGLKLYPADSRTAVKLAHAYSDMGRYEEALQALSWAEEWDPSSSYPLAYRGIVELQAGFPDMAADYFQQALDIDYKNTIAKEGLKAVQKIVSEQDSPLPTPPTPHPETLQSLEDDEAAPNP